MSDDNRSITISLDALAKQLAAGHGLDRQDWWTDAENVEYFVKIRNGKLTVEYYPVGQVKKRSIS